MFLLGGGLYLVYFASGRAVVRPEFFKFLCDTSIHLNADITCSPGQMLTLSSTSLSFAIQAYGFFLMIQPTFIAVAGFSLIGLFSRVDSSDFEG